MIKTRFYNIVFFVYALALISFSMITMPNTAFSQHETKNVPSSSIDIGNIEAQEGSDFFTLEVRCFIRFRERSSEAESCDVLAAEAAEYIQVEPKVEFQVVAGSSRFRLVGAFAPRTTYSITFLPGLRAEHQAVLTTRVAKTIQTPGLKPTLRFLGRARYVPRLQGAVLPFEARNVEHLRVSFRQVFPQNLIFWLTKNQEETPTDVAEEVAHTELRLQRKGEEKISSHISLDTIEKFGQGVFQVIVERLDNTDGHTRLDSATVVITDIAAVAKQDGDDLYVWTRSAVDMRARPGVQVQARTYNNRAIASCTTSDDDAGCVLKGLLRQSQKPYALILTAGHDLSYLRFSDVEIVDERVHAGLRPYAEAGVALEAYVYASRGVYGLEKPSIWGLWCGRRPTRRPREYPCSGRF